MSSEVEGSEPVGSERRRQVVVFADLAESVRLMQDHEAEAIHRWRLFAKHAEHHLLPGLGGRLVRTAGDGLLMVFMRVSDAVAAAFALHFQLAEGNSPRHGERSMLLRIGVHVADVVEDERELYGAGVNLAARLASLAAPGGTVISAPARGEIADSVHADVEDLGLRFVKHLKEPVRAFSLRPAGSFAVREAALPSPSDDDLRPGIAVVPFEAVPADAVHEALGHAMADDIIAALARHPGIRVLSRASTGSLRGLTLDAARLQQLSRVLDASFLLTGRYYVLGSRVRLNVELCDLPGGNVQWSSASVAEVEALFAGHDELVPHIVANVGQRMLARELSRVRSLPMSSLASYTLFLGATGLMNSLVRADFMRARQVLDHLADRHPRQAAPCAMLARWHVFNSAQGWTEDREQEARRARDLAIHAIELDPRQAVALTALALTRLNFDGDVEGAVRDNLRAIEADPLDPHAWAQISAAHTFAGDCESACRAAARALSISPLDPNRYLFESYAAMALLACGRHAEAITQARASVRHHALHAPSHRMLVGALWLDGRHEEARRAVQGYLVADPQACVTTARRRLGERAPWREAFDEALLEAGLPA